ncbi:LysR family transcriptional regulator [Pikeienuella piscinae]|uniref:LysR family transcriptional regulator n=1 Tax=Pikeienuella piscinae TaxID=2748098 RepID=A0A7L5BUC9_9RHOB|nr:LysR substrate-binding domain-containing protein [Pikeienuella piscinae]QIE53977.1 LysR family transcriptional regulator [Pikeienuella piscinae]
MADWTPSLNALRAFETVARRLNYQRAAEELRVTPAAVKQLVRKLEEAVGAKLVSRSGRGLALTEAGRAGSVGLTAGFGQIRAAADLMRRSGSGQRLIVSVEPSFAAAWLVPRLERFRRLHQDIAVLVDSSLRIVDLRAGEADIAIRFGVPVESDLITHRLFDEELRAFCSPALSLGPDAIRRPQDLARATLLHWDLSELGWAAATRRWMDWADWLARVGAGDVAPGDGLRFSDYNLATQAAVAGQGVLLGSAPILRGLIDAGLLCNPFPESVVTDIGYDLVATAAGMARPDAARFIEWMLAETES